MICLPSGTMSFLRISFFDSDSSALGFGPTGLLQDRVREVRLPTKKLKLCVRKSPCGEGAQLLPKKQKRFEDVSSSVSSEHLKLTSKFKLVKRTIETDFSSGFLF